MHIALLSNFLPPDEEYGIPRYVYELADSLGQAGHSVDVIAGCPDSNRADIDEENFRIHWVFNGIKSAKYLPALKLLGLSYRIRKRLLSLHEQFPFEVVEYPNLTYPGLWTALQRLPAPSPSLVVRLSSPTRNVPSSGFLPFRASEWLESLAVRNSDAYIGNTSENLDVCKSVYKLDPKLPHTVILHGTPGQIKPELHFRERDAYTALFVGRIEPRKGFDVLLKAWEIVIQQIPNAKLVVAGEDMPWRGGDSYYNWSLSQVSEMTASSIDYHGFVSPEIKESLYRDSDIFVAPSRYESFGLVFLEAMRYGKPVISCHVGGIPDVIADGETGILVKPEDAEGLAEALVTLFSNADLRKKMGKNAVKSVNEKFSQERVALETGDFYTYLTQPSQ